MAASYSGKTAYSNIPKFQHVAEDNLIATLPFLDACSSAVSTLDLLGTAFSIAKKDVQSNVKKIQECYQTNPDLYKTLDVVMEEKKVTGPLIWLLRAMRFILIFMDSLMQDNANGVNTENLRQNVLKAYESTLKPYHGKMTQFLFSNIARLVPHRKDFLKALFTAPDSTVDMIFSDLDLYIPDFQANIDLAQQLLEQHGLEDQTVV